MLLFYLYTLFAIRKIALLLTIRFTWSDPPFSSALNHTRLFPALVGTMDPRDQVCPLNKQSGIKRANGPHRRTPVSTL